MTKLATAVFSHLREDVGYQSIGLDPKRPFWNSDVYEDLLDILDFPLSEDPEKARNYVQSLWISLIPFLRQEWHKYQAMLTALDDMRQRLFHS